MNLNVISFSIHWFNAVSHCTAVITCLALSARLSTWMRGVFTWKFYQISRSTEHRFGQEDLVFRLLFQAQPGYGPTQTNKFIQVLVDLAFPTGVSFVSISKMFLQGIKI